MTETASPEFTESWPVWGRFLIGVPLRIAVILLAAWLVLLAAHAIIKRVARRIARLPGRGSARVSRRGSPRGSPGAARLSAPGVAPGDSAADPDAAFLAARREARFMTLAAVFRSATTVIVWVLAICLVLESVGVNPGVLMTSIGVLGVGLGLGAQSLVKDMLSGLLMLIEDQYGLGDVIDTGAATGVVESMSLRVTTLRDQDGVLWYVPNGTIARIGNRSQSAAPPEGVADQVDPQAGAS
ncbi:MAG: mechanosensitive ion channel family protein [Propionibacteriaceae bacterium]|jgi:small conductance mechanosensitive channel|nr:mechanosensitive ion channel family protein [Propionibacteriaceae bacterium]